MISRKERVELEQDEQKEVEYWLGRTTELDGCCHHCDSQGLIEDNITGRITCKWCYQDVEEEGL